jgi:hypothetical protein
VAGAVPAVDHALGAGAKVTLHPLVGIQADEPVRFMSERRLHEPPMVPDLVPARAVRRNSQHLQDMRARLEELVRTVRGPVVERDDAIDVGSQACEVAGKEAHLVPAREQGKQ